MTVEVRVPATSANMGAGFDSMGIALAIYNQIKISEIESGLRIINTDAQEFIPTNENNLIYRAVVRVFDEVGYRKKGIEIIQKSNIPVTRGLGSSSACIIGGVLGGNVISGRKLSYERLIEIAAEMEGHPDNVVPAMYGGFCVSVNDGKKIYKKSIKPDASLKYAVMVPEYFVRTKKSRGILPEKVLLKDAAHNISRAAWLTACFATGDFDNIRPGVEDKIHQPYRRDYVEGMDNIFEKTYLCGSKATFLSGSGPAIVSVLDKDYDLFKERMNDYFMAEMREWKCMIAEIDNVGAIVKTVK